ncbi:hypothetical protein GCM10009113_36330 [Marinobacter szutsaonensis]
MDRVARLILAREVPVMTVQEDRNIPVPAGRLMMVLVVPDTPDREVLRTMAQGDLHTTARVVLVTPVQGGHVIQAPVVQGLIAQGFAASNFHITIRVTRTH